MKTKHTAHVFSHITEPGPSQASVDPLRAYSNDHSGKTANQHNSGKSHLADVTCVEKQEPQHLPIFVIVWSLGDEGDGPIYSPVSPDQNPPSEDDYDDIGS